MELFVAFCRGGVGELGISLRVYIVYSREVCCFLLVWKLKVLLVIVFLFFLERLGKLVKGESSFKCVFY